jgi:hypothetical protein
MGSLLKQDLDRSKRWQSSPLSDGLLLIPPLIPPGSGPSYPLVRCRPQA